MHRSRLCHVVIDVPDLDQGVSFWSAALGATAEPGATMHIYRKLRLPDSEVRVLLQKTSDKKASKEHMHLDLETDDVAAEVKRLEALGAQRWDHQQERDFDFWVMRDPWDNEFCVLQAEFPELLAQREPWNDDTALSATSLLAEGLALRERRRLKAASAYFERAVTANPTMAEGWFWLAVTRDNRGEEARAIPAYRQALKLGIEDRNQRAQAWTWLASSLSKTGHHSEALTALKEAVRLKGYEPMKEFQRLRVAIGRRAIRADREAAFRL